MEAMCASWDYHARKPPILYQLKKVRYIKPFQEPLFQEPKKAMRM